MTTGKTIALTRWTFVDKVMSLLFNMPSGLVITFLPRSKCLSISWLQSPSAVILEPRKIKSATNKLYANKIFKGKKKIVNKIIVSRIHHYIKIMIYEAQVDIFTSMFENQ